MRTGISNLPLHGGKAPRWLFSRMTKLAREMTIWIVREYGPEDMIRRLADPHWFQAFGCVLGFDWHSSGVTTTVCGAVKEGISGLETDLGLFLAGGKGGRSRKTPAELEAFGPHLSVDPAGLVYASRMSAKVDNTALQDGYQLYHHLFMCTRDGYWGVVQQGMNETNHYARRYHWLGEGVDSFITDPHAAVCCDSTGTPLNMATAESTEAQKVSAAIAIESPEKTARELSRLKTLTLPRRHHVLLSDIDPHRIGKILLASYETQPATFEALLATRGIGPKTIRSLALISELVYGAPVSFRDPVRFSFAHGGKDGHPYPVNREVYDTSIAILRDALNGSKIDRTEKEKAFKRLAGLEG